MRPLARRLPFALSLVSILLAATAATAAEPPPPTDAELTKYVAIQRGLAGDSARAAEVCEMLSEDSDQDSGRGDELAAAARRAEAHPLLGPLLKRHGLTGRRYVEVTVHVGSVLIAAAMADETGAGLESVTSSTPGAKAILARRQELTVALEAVQALCDGDDEESYDDGGYGEDDGA